MHTPESLAAELKCSRAEAFDRLERIRQDLRPYFYAKQAPIDAEGKPVPGLTVQIAAQGGPQTSRSGADVPPWLYLQSEPAPDAATEQNQRLIDVSPSVSHAEPSDQT
jgi:hypothetical protein